MSLTRLHTTCATTLLILLAVFAFSSCKETQSKTIAAPHVAEILDSATEVSFIFIGDVMQHGPQIRAAFVDSLDTYDYTSCFENIAPITQAADFSIANLEVTLAGEPYSGYPQFSAPDQLAVALKNAGIRYLVTANNHSADRHTKGIIRTVNILDSLGINHTGTFTDSANRAQRNILWFEKNGIKVALLNYTFSTNGIVVQAPAIVNYIDSVMIKADIKTAQQLNPDKIIVFTHWGDEYQLQPNAYQKLYAEICLRYGADYVIGSHPHVLEPMHHWYDSTRMKENIVVYSLGNFVSNQRERYKDGGAMFKLVLQKKEKKTEVKEAGYFLTWVNKWEENGKNHYAIYPVSQYENDTVLFNNATLKTMLQFKDDSHTLFEKYNTNIGEYVFDAKTQQWGIK
jgi:poly-gamma-glutamate capsule biosynthesis protein CapA/YwtB (metallophosphatase superfamily)